jgi:hypothetical protein
MNAELDRLFTQIHDIEADIEAKLAAYRTRFRYRLTNGKAVFEAEAKKANARLRTSIPRYLRETPLKHILVAPIIYAMIVPIVLLDLSVSAYQWICFTAWGIARVSRRDYIAIDRHRLGYLNAIEKLNCVYCGYGNGVLAYVREVFGRTEQYWCPIRHATQIRGAHARYKDFADYGDAEKYRAKLDDLRAKLR